MLKKSQVKALKIRGKNGPMGAHVNNPKTRRQSDPMGLIITEPMGPMGPDCSKTLQDWLKKNPCVHNLCVQNHMGHPLYIMNPLGCFAQP